MNTLQELPSLEDAMKILESCIGKPVQLQDYRLLRYTCEFETSDSSLSDFMNISSRQEHQIPADSNLILVKTEFEVKFQDLPQQLSTQEDDSQRPHSVVRVCFATGITYSFDEAMSEKERLVYSKLNGIIHSWPYFRSMVASVLPQMGIGHVPIIPLLPHEKAMNMAGFRSRDDSGKS